MKRMKVFLMVVIVGMLFSSICFAAEGEFKSGSEPDGFGGIKWGTDIKTLRSMKYVKTEPDYGGVDRYTRKGDDLHIGGAKLEKIEYRFWRGKFFGVSVWTKGPANWYGLKDVCFKKFGKDYQEDCFPPF